MRARLLISLSTGFLVVGACAGVGRRNPIDLELENRTGGPVEGALLRFDRDLATVDRLEGPFASAELRLAQADTVRLTGGVLPDGSAAVYWIAGRDGAPRLLDARWIVDGRLGRRIFVE